MVALSIANSNRRSVPSRDFTMRFTPRVRNKLLAINIAAWLIYLATDRETTHRPTAPVVLSGSAPPGKNETDTGKRIVEVPTIISTKESSWEDTEQKLGKLSNSTRSVWKEDDLGPGLFQKMCPNMVPNHNVWPRLFQLARIELDFPVDQIVSKPVDGRAFENFFKFNAGGIGYTSPDNKHHTAIIRLFKAGNDQIRINLIDMLKEGEGNVVEKDTIHNLQLTNQTCVVTAVRDPIERFLSGYNEVEYRREIRVREGNEEDGPSYTRLVNGTTDRFEQFVKDLLDGPKSSGMYKHKKNGIEEITHVFSMTGILFGLHRIKECNGDEVHLSAYLPSLNNLDEEFPKLLSETCPGLHEIHSFEKKITHPSQLDEFNFYSAAKKVWKNEGAMSRALCIIHALDYACYDSIPIPSTCQNVYKEERFQRNLAQAASRRDKYIPAWVNANSKHAWAALAKRPGWVDPACGHSNYA